MPRLRDDAADCARGYRTTPWLPYLPGPHSSPGAADVRRVQGARNVFSRAPALPCGSFESETGFVSDKWGPRPPRRGHMRVKQVLFQVSGAPALPGRSSEGETIRNRSSLRDLGIPSRLTSAPPFVVLRGPSWISLFLLSFFVCFRQVSPPPPRRCASLRGKTAVRQ